LKLWRIQHSGFSLIELCISLSILGIMIGVGSGLLRTYHRVHCHKVTEEHQNHILKAVVWFVLQEKRMPCPSSLESRGQESLGQWSGLVPFKTLGLSQKVAKDGFGHWMRFIVEPSLTDIQMRKPRPLALCKFFLDASNSLTLFEKGEPIVDSGNMNGIACIVISHGPKGIGSPGHSRSALGHAVLSKGKMMNMQEGSDYCYSPALDDTGIWDDYVSFKTKLQILQEIGLTCQDYFFPAPVLGEKKL
jgi:prepilin-type N-terminal cleavage/methylation domain-containing protein